MSAADVAVVGGGIVGSALAWEAARLGATVLWVDRHDPGRATDAGAGIVSPATDILAPPALARFAAVAGETYPDLVAALPAESGYARCGALLVAQDEDEALRLPRPGTALRMLGPGEAHELFPGLGRVARALLNPAGARVDGRLLNAALGAAAATAGTRPERGDVERIEVAGGRAVALVVDGEARPCRAVVIAGGAWTPQLARALGREVPVAPQRGQIVHLRTSADRPAGERPIVHGLRDHYLVPWPDGRVSAGATRETGSGFDTRTTAAGLREVLTEALRLAPVLADAELVEIRVGLRPLSADGLPVLGRLPGLANVWLATGHGPAGLTLGPHSARVVARAALGEESDPIFETLSPARFIR